MERVSNGLSCILINRYRYTGNTEEKNLIPVISRNSMQFIRFKKQRILIYRLKPQTICRVFLNYLSRSENNMTDTCVCRPVPGSAVPGRRDHHPHHLLRHEGQPRVQGTNVLDLLRYTDIIRSPQGQYLRANSICVLLRFYAFSTKIATPSIPLIHFITKSC